MPNSILVSSPPPLPHQFLIRLLFVYSFLLSYLLTYFLPSFIPSLPSFHCSQGYFHNRSDSRRVLHDLHVASRPRSRRHQSAQRAAAVALLPHDLLAVVLWELYLLDNHDSDASPCGCWGRRRWTWCCCSSFGIERE